MSEPISIIVTTKNEEGVIERLLKSVKAQTYKNIEIVVVDNYSSDSTRDIAKKYTDKVFLEGPERSAQRNYGARKSKGRFLLFLDADMKLSPKVVEECVKVVNQDKKIAGVVILEESIASNFWEKVKAYERSFYNLEGDEVTDAARFFKSEVFEKLKGFDETITGPEDWDLTDRVKKKGYEIARVSSKIYHYEKITSLFSLVKKKYYYGLKAHRYLKKQKVKVISPKTIYFLRPIFYKHWKRLISKPILSLAMFTMFFLEMFVGGVGYLVGKIKNI
ncbi:glycosyltransferase [Patescibacteria group bacterium]|nr:glycosyltransferase [Patescibacteria group bacterium]